MNFLYKHRVWIIVGALILLFIFADRLLHFVL